MGKRTFQHAKLGDKRRTERLVDKQSHNEEFVIAQ
jgi:hypothetical protein